MHTLRLRLLITLCSVALIQTTFCAAEIPKYLPNYTPLAHALAREFFSGKDTGAAALTAFVAEKKIVGKKFTDEFTAVVAVGHALIADGVKPDSEYFFLLLESSVNSPAAPIETVAGDKATSPRTPAPEKEKEKPAPESSAENDIQTMASSGPISFFHGGVRLLSPYKFRYDEPSGKGYLDKAGSTDSTAFIEYVYAHRAAWSAYWLAKEQELQASQNGVRPPVTLKSFLEDFSLDDFDFETRINYNFSGTENSASAVAGSGDFGAEVSIALPLVMHLHDTTKWQQGGWTAGPEVSYGVTTDRSAFDARQRLFYGLGYTLSYNLSNNPKNTRWLMLHTRLGEAQIDTIKFVNDTTLEAHVVNGTLPRYEKERAIAFETDVIYPLSKDSHLTFGGRIYDGPKPNAWTLYFGYTKSITDIAKALFPNLGADEKSSGGADTEKARSGDTSKQTAAPTPPKA